MDTEESIIGEPSREETMKYVLEMLSQLADMSERCGETAFALSLRTLVLNEGRTNGRLVDTN